MADPLDTPQGCNKPTARREPFIVAPIRSHRQSFIILHGRGSNGPKFGSPFVEEEIPQYKTMTAAFPDAKFIFPTASVSRATIYKKSQINQWFDNWHLERPLEREELQINGLCESVSYIHGLIRQEIDLVGSQNVVLGGLSQGCATTIISLLLWNDEPLSAAFGMCGWMPFQKHLSDIAQDADRGLDQEDDPFSRFDDEDSGVQDAAKANESSPASNALGYLREELEVPSSTPAALVFQHTPIFLGHGIKDDRVPVTLGRDASSCLQTLGADVEWKEYTGLGHWYSCPMLADLIAFIKQKTGWPTA